MESEIVTLTLNTNDIFSGTNQASFYNKTIDNMYGTITNNRCTNTWKNINMRFVLGVLYDKYETFNIKLYQITQTSGALGSGNPLANYTLVDVRVSGLPFLNNSYNIASSNNTNSIYLTSYVLNNLNFLQTGGSITVLYPITLTFGKSTEYVDITIDIKNTLDQKYPTIPLNSALGPTSYVFKIYGIPKTESKVITNRITNGTRMNLLQR